MHLYWVKYDASKLKNFYTVGNVLKSSETFTMDILRLRYIYANFFQRRAIGQNVPFLANRAF